MERRRKAAIERKKIIEHFHDSVKASLRRGDAYTRYSPSEVPLMLMEIKLEKIVTLFLNGCGVIL